MVEIVSTYNEEVDRQIGGGLPLPMMMIIEGDNGTGKSALSAQFIWGLLKKGMKVLLITDNTVKNYIEKMKIITYDFTKFFLYNQFRIIPMYAFGASWSKEQSKLLLPILSRYISANSNEYDAVFIDSLSLLCMYANTDSILNFFTKCKHLVSNGTSLFMTLHESIIPQDISLQIKSTCDGYIKLNAARVAGREVKVSNIIKYAGASSQVSNQFSFDVDTLFGIKIVPLSMANG